MIILGIETSCDETAASAVKDGHVVLSHVLATSADLHAKTGGIIPEMAAREQVKSIIPVIQGSLIQSTLHHPSSKHHLPPSIIHPPAIDAIAVTYGPGLIGSLLVGVETAKTLSYVWNKPLVPVNHLTGHIYANFIREIPNEIEFPALALVVSGGHTDLVLMEKHGKVEWVGGTRDDAAGEAFDKTARLLGLPYPGGPSIAAETSRFLGQPLSMFPRPLIDENNFDWSFSGLKTAVFREVQKAGELTDGQRAMYAAEVQEAIVDVLVTKTLRAVQKIKPKSLLLGGGVAANQRLRERLTFEIGNLKFEIGLFIAPPKYCTDNASMIAAAAYYNYKEVPRDKVTALPELTILGEI